MNKLRDANYFKLFFIFLFASLFGVMLMNGIDITCQISQFPVASLSIKIVLFILFIIVFILKKRKLLLYLFLISFPFMRIMFVGITLLTAYTVILIVIYRKEIVALYVNKKNTYGPYFLIILFCLVVTTFISQYPYSAIPEVIFFLSLGGIYFVLTSFMDSEYRQKVILQLLILIFIFCVTVSFLQLFFGINSIRFFFGEYNRNVDAYNLNRRIPSVFWEAQGAGQYFAVIIMLLLGLADSYFRKFKWLLRGLILFGIIALFLTKSRMAIFAFIFSVCLIQVFAISFKKLIGLITLIMFLLLSGGLFYSFILPSEVRARFKQYEIMNSLDYRVRLWKESWPIVTHNPLGVGLGADNLYEASIKQKVFSVTYFNDFRLRERGIQFENSYLHILYSLGILGLLAFLMLIIKYFSLGVTLFRKNYAKAGSRLFLHLLVAMVIWLLCIFTSPQILEAQSMIVFIILLALMNSSWQIYSIES